MADQPKDRGSTFKREGQKAGAPISFPAHEVGLSLDFSQEAIDEWKRIEGEQARAHAKALDETRWLLFD